MQQLSQEQAGPHLLVEHAQFGTPQQAQTQVLFEFAKRQFDIPSARIQARDVGDGEHGRIEHIGQVGVALAAHTKTDQAHDLSGLIRAIPAQVDQGVADAVGLIEHVPHLVTGLADRARDVPIALLREVIQPGKAEIATIKQDERALGQTTEHGTGMHLAISGSIQQHVEAPPLLQAHIKEAHQPSRQQATVTVRHLAHPRHPALDLVEHAFIERHHPCGKGGQAPVLVRRQAGGQPRRELAKERLKRADPVLLQTVVDRLIGQRQPRQGANAKEGNQPPHLCLAVQAPQQAHPHRQAQMPRTERHRAASRARGGCCLHRQADQQVFQGLIERCTSSSRWLGCSIIGHQEDAPFVQKACFESSILHISAHDNSILHLSQFLHMIYLESMPPGH